MTHVLIFANGDAQDGLMVRRALAQAESPLVIAADGGARVAQVYGFTPHVIVGDFDSLSRDEQAEFRARGAEFLFFSPEKDFTDLELALKLAHKRGATWIRLIGGVGTRLDQTIANLYLLVLPELLKVDARLVAGDQEAYILYPGDHDLYGAVGDTVSLIPIGGAVAGIRTEGLAYPLNDETLTFGPARGISNVLQATTGYIYTRSGILLVIHTVGRA